MLITGTTATQFHTIVKKSQRKAYSVGEKRGEQGEKNEYICQCIMIHHTTLIG